MAYLEINNIFINCVDLNIVFSCTWGQLKSSVNYKFEFSTILSKIVFKLKGDLNLNEEIILIQISE